VDSFAFRVGLRFGHMATHEAPVLYSADFADCQALTQITADELVDIFVSALTRAGATVVQTLSHAFPETGLTSVLILSESHAVLHTWPETGTVNLDVFSCSTRLKSLEAVNELGRALGARGISVQEVPRADGHRPISANARV